MAIEYTNTRTRAAAPPRGWRQYKYWCWHCGVNISHESMLCRKPLSEARKHPNATRTTPEGGNMKRERYWGMWNHPSLAEPQPTRAFPTSWWCWSEEATSSSSNDESINQCLHTSHLATPTSSPHSCQNYLTLGRVKTIKKVRFTLPRAHNPLKDPETFNAWVQKPIINHELRTPLLNKLRIASRTKKPILNALQAVEVEEAQAEVAGNYLMGALDSGATDHFMPTHYQGTNPRTVLTIRDRRWDFSGRRPWTGSIQTITHLSIGRFVMPKGSEPLTKRRRPTRPSTTRISSILLRSSTELFIGTDCTRRFRDSSRWMNRGSTHR